ncbi:amino acid adenylation domain-containing protein [Rhodococcus sp. ARC_M8]|uniref:non-ribosomal peptide synthetase n=1 Tax=Rhodococcus erythropolis TaxID=1833 RepID=UPI001EDF61C0|nr:MULTISPECIES: non-ribosomal peptide synthetase [Rhodococcus]MCJ0946757.1 amino acid adenylation domain-containing protein [Rhodococcus sp. ARC_M8]UKO84134.1 amino acid adenylation domain-containing protein [Rhodococcus erythropolis]
MKPFEVSRTDPSGETLFPLSAAQRATWFAQQFDPEVPILIAHYVELRGELDVELLDRETRAVAYEFQSPLLKVIEIDGHPMQYVDEKAEISVGLVDFRGSPDPIEDALGWMRRDCRTQLDLAVDGIVATAVLRVGDAHYLWYSRIHHVALDGFGAMTMMNRIAHRYSASAARKDSQPSRAATLRTLYDIDERYRMSDRFAADREYWAERNTTLAGSSLAEASGPAQTESRLESTLISDRSCALLYESENHAAPVIAALALYLARMTAKETVQIHVPMSGRTTAVLRDSGGMMVNVTPLLIRVAAVDTVGELFAQVQHELMGALRHQRCSLDDIRRDAGVTSGLEGEDSYAGPMVNVMLFRQEVQLGEVVGEYHIITSGPVEDLLVNVYPSGDRLRVDFRANPIRYEEAGLREHHRNFVGLLEELIASDSGAELADIHGPTAREGERRQREVRHLEYWRHELAGAPELLQLPFDRPRPATQSLDSAQVEVLIAADTHARITAMASDLGTDTRAVLHASFALLVSRLSGASDVVIGTPAGSDANIVAIRSRVDLVTTFTALLYSVVEVHSNARAHSEIRLEQLVQPLHVEDVPAYAPVVQVTFESVTGADEHPRDIGRFDLGVSAVETFDEVGTPSGISVRLAFATDLFDAETVRGLGLRFARVLESVTADPAIMVGDIDILSDVERSAIRPVRSDPRASHRTLADLFDGAARTHPDGVALSYLDAELTYRELDERSSKLARELIDRGIGPENIVALGMTRSIESVVAMLAVSKAGAAFVPVDPTYPDERVRFMLTDSGAVLGLTVVAELHRLPDSVPWSAIDDAEFRGRFARLSVRSISDVDRVHPIRPDNPAYVIYTSGSTGLPKGVTVSHRGLEALAAEQRSRFGATQDARTLHFSTPSFDASIFEYLLAFGAGATMVIAPSTIYGGDELSHFLESQRVTHGFVTTAALGTVSPEGLSDFGEVVVGGEACPPDLVQRWAPGRRLCNAYGPTETTVMSNIGEPMVSSEDITVGGPLRGFEEIVLDQRLHPVPDGVVGELYISGDALARGYHRKYALTAERFVADPFGLPGQRMYRTGDLVRWRRGRGLEYVGRSDFQVKVRGFRIELGEIDSVVRSCPQVENAVTVARAAPSGTAMITTYVVPAGGSALSTAELTRYVASRVPSYMVPAAFVLLDELPVTPAGKVDRAALPAPRLDARSDDFRPPEGAEELVLAEIFADVLGVETVGAGDDFFDLGGNSLIATKLIARVNAAEEIDFGVRTLFEAPTIESLARHVRDAKSSRVDRTRSKRPILQAHSYRDKIPVSVAQRRLWFVNQFDTSSPAYNIPMVVRLSGALDVAAMQRAVGDVVDRHESLRTVYPASVDGPHQVVVPSERVTSKIAWEVSVDEEALDRRIADLAREGFDVSANVPLRGSLFRVTPDDHVLALVVHHISADGASLEPLARDLTRAYAARAAKRAPDWSPLPVQYADYSQWQIELLGSDDDPDTLEAKQLDYWTSTLAGLPDVIDLPLDRPRPAERSMRGESVRFSVPADVHSELLELARNHNTTPFMVMHAVLAVLLARLSASPDIAIGTPVGGRAEQVLDDLVGMFVNTVVLRITVDTAATFEEILSRTREVDLAAFGQAEVPFERVVDAVAPERSSSRSPLFQVLLEFQNTADPHLELPGLGVDVVPVDVGVAKFDLQLSLSEQRGKDGLPMGFDAAFTYASDIFERTTVAEFGERFVRLLRSVVSDPTVPVGDTEILGVPERGLVVGGWDGVGVVVGGLTLVDVLDGRFAGVGGGGLVCGGVVLSWGEFDVRVNRFARLLISLGVGPESRVCVALSRSVELLVAVFAVVRAGGVFVPVDVGAPVERVGFVVGVVDPVVVLSRVGDGGCLPVGVGFVDVGCVDVSGFSGGPVGVGDRLGVLLPEHAVYVMFTSGSTGRPKGVVVSHAGVVNRLLWMQGEFPLGVGDVVLQKTPVSFDVSVWELFWPLMVGARLVVADPGGHRDPVYLVGVIERWGVSVVHFVPSMLEVFVGELSVGELGVGCSGLRRVFVSGEGLSSVLAGRFAGVCGAELVNLYGPTEASVDVTFHVVEGVVGVGVPIGRPVWNTRVLVLDSRLRPVPVGVVGELYVGGVQVARGYEGRVDLTVGRFVADPVSGVVGARVYRTGDVVRWGCGGVLEFVGRTDFQVKVRGQRVELGEVEAVLAAQVGVAGAVVVLRSGVGGDFLVGFVVGEVGVVVDEVVVLEGVRRSLPGFMVPSVVVVLGEFPVTVHGKLDRKALPDTDFASAAYRIPATPAEIGIARAVADVLGLDQVGADDSFFELGGDSLSATRVIARINAALHTNMGVNALFDAPVVADLAASIDPIDSAPGEPGPEEATRVPLTSRARPERIPLSFAQSRMWFVNQFDTSSPLYNIPVALQLDGFLDSGALQAALGDVVERHESLRTIFPASADGPYQVIAEPAVAAPRIHPVPIPGEWLFTDLHAFFDIGFDVSEGFPLHVRLLRTGPEQHVLAIVVHHIAADGFSMAPLARDLMSAYTARTQGRSPDWAPLPVQYADYTLWQREIVDADVGPETSPSAEFDYWTAKLSGIPDVLPLPLDRPRTSKRSAEGAVVSMDFSPEIHRALNELAHQNGSSLFMVMHAALAVLLARLTTADDVVIGTPVAGRGASVFDDVVGMFVNTLVLRTPVSSGATFAEVLAAVRSTDLGALDHADIPFERLVDYLSPDRSTEHSPLFQVLLEFQTDTGLRFDLPELTVRSLDVDLAVAKFDLQLSVMEHVDEHGEPAGISAGFRYATDIFDRMSVARIAARFERVIGAVTENQSVVVGDIDMILAGELSGLLVAPTPSGAGTDEDSLSDLFDRTALTSGAAVAVRCGGLSVTYRELDERANRLARLLVAQGVGPETLVAVAMARSIDLMVALLAVVKAGGGYVPVDSTSPVNRVDFVLRDARPKCVLTTRADGDYIRDSDAIADSEIPVIAVDDPVILDALHRFSPLAVTDRDRLLPLRPESVAYVIYTSGSTGRPKGVQVSHRSVVTLLANTRALFGFGSGDVWTMFHSEAFDFSVWEMWGALAHGGRLVLVDYFTARSPEAFLELLRHERVTVLNQTPTAFYQLAEADRLAGGAALSLRYVIFGGEALDFGQLTRWYARRGTSSPDLVNMYGITETTVHVSHLPLDRVLVRQRSASVIGRALPGLRVYVLDQRLHPVPPGVVGELYVSGDQVSRGYLGRFGLTSARFIPDLAVSGARMYRSGDLGRWNDSGQLEYLGRNDLQVQVKGYRIELGEVEAALLSGVGVSQSAVVARRDRLVGYVVPESGATISPAALLEYVSQRLAPHMVPAVVTVLEGLPLTVNGKLDRNALPEPDFGRQATVSRGPASATENILASLFAEVLGLEEVGVDDSFFTLGGDSIMSIQLVTRARSAGVLITPREVFERKTVAALSETAGTAGNRVVVDELPGGGVGEIELTPIVEWMLDRGGDFRRYSQSVLLSVPATLDEVTLTLAMQAVLDHHDILRAGIRATHHPESARRMDVAPVGTVRAETVVRHVSLGGSAAETVSTELDAALGRLDPEAGVMVQAVLLDTDGQIQKDRQSRKRLLLVAHHLVTDGVSWRILIPDLALACAQVQSGVDPSLAPVGTSMRRWAHGLVDAAREPDRVAEIDYWREVLEGPDPTLGVRALTKRDTASATIDIEVRVPTGLTEAVSTTVPQAIHGSVEDGLLTALALAMVRWRMDRGIDNPETLISLEGHGREEQVVLGADLARTVGWFTSIFPVRIDLSRVDPSDAFAGGPAAGVAAKAVKEQLRAVPDRGIGFGLLRYLNRETAHTLSQLPVPQISFNYLGRVGGTDADASAGWVPIRDEDLRTVAAVDLPLASVLEVNVMTVDSDTEDGPQLVASWTFPPDILGADDVRQLGQWWLDALAGLGEFAAGGGGFTPSDFDLVDLRQEAIDDLESRCPDLSDVWPLSPLQAGLLFHAELAERSVDAYLVQVALDLAGAVDSERLRRAADALLGRHENLRTAFLHSADGRAVQVVRSNVAAPWQEIDLTGAPDQEIDRALAEDRARPFDMARAPLIRFTLIALAPEKLTLVLTNHHILLDGWSMPLLIRELATLYAADGQVAALPHARAYRDYLTWMSRRDQQASRAVWARTLSGVEGPTLLAPAVRSRRLSTMAAEWVFDLDEEFTTSLRGMARELGLTINTIVQASWGIVLAALTGRDDVVFGATVSGRPPELTGIETMVGLFINTIPVRITLRPSESIGTLLERIQAEQAELSDHHCLGLSEIHVGAGPEIGFDTLTVFESYPVDRQGLSSATDIAGVRITDVEAKDAAHYPLSLVASVDTRLRLKFEYIPEVFGAADIEEIAGRLRRVLEACTQPDRPLAVVSVLAASEHAGLVPVRGTAGGSSRVFPEIFDEAAQRDPNAPAVESADGSMTYGELDILSNRIARMLVSHGLGTEDYVAVGIPRSLASVVSILAVAKTGAAFVPIDPDYPDERINHMLIDSKVSFGLTTTAGRDRLPDIAEWLIIDDPHFTKKCEGFSGSPLTDNDRLRPIGLDSAAYVVYTSGSTGVPKGVVVTQRGLDNFARDQLERYGATPQSRTLHFSTPSFDGSLFEYLQAFGAGATMVIAPPGIYGGEDLAQLLAEHAVTHAFVTTAALASVDPAGLEQLSEVVFGGEACPPDLVARWAPGRRLYNAYGPTEATIMSNVSPPMTAGEPITIGGPVRGVSELVLDTRLQAVPVGVPGELYLAGPGVARGYHRRAGLTAERFVANPADPGTRMYRTGDIVRWTADMCVEYVGRSDFQVKVRGFRVELGEIDSVLMSEPNVGFAVTVADSAPTGDTRLVSYVVPTAGRLDTRILSRAVARRLPSHMVPAVLTVLENIPLTAVGKVDRSALPRPEIETTTGDFRPAVGPVEQAVSDVFGEVLGLERVGTDISFFELGGNSLSATSVAARLRAVLGATVGVRDLFETPTVAELATVIGQSVAEGSERLGPRPRPDNIPLSFAQQRMWFVNQLDTSSPAYNIPLVVRLSGELDKPALRSAMSDVIARHESLRTMFPVHGDGPVQHILPTESAELPQLTETSVTDEHHLRDELARMVSAGFDVAARIPLRAALFTIDEREHVLAVVVHHISADGFSMSPLTRDVMIAYEAHAYGGDPQWTPLPVQYADFALWQREILGSVDDPGSVISEQLAYWRRALSGAPDLLELPLDRDRPTQQSFHGSRIHFSISNDLHRRILNVSRQHESTAFMTVHAALALLLARLGSTDDIVIGTPIAGRGDRALDDLVGMFVGTLALRTQVDPARSFRELVEHCREVDLAAFAHSDVPFERVVDAVGPKRSSAYAPISSVSLEFQNNKRPILKLPGLEVRGIDPELEVVKVDLEFLLAEEYDDRGEPGGMSGAVDFATDLFDPGTVGGFADMFVRVLEAVTRNPQVPIGDIDLLGDPERRELTPAHGLPEVPPKLWPELLADAVAIDPDSVALSLENRQLSYRDLDEWSNRVARELCGRGVGPETFVALGMPRSIESVVAIWSVTKAGAAFVPVDPAYPRERVEYMLADCRASLGLTVQTSRTHLPDVVPWLELDDPHFARRVAALSPEPITDDDRTGELNLDHPAYLIYTSGSTGKPKGVNITHRGLASFTAETRERFEVTHDSHVSQLASPSFDASIFELTMAFSASAQVVIVPPAVYGGAELADVFRREQVTHATITPTALAALGDNGFEALRVLDLVGEACPPEVVAQWAPGRRLHNGYGPTETTVQASVSDSMKPGAGVNIGSPAVGFGFLVLDERLQPVPVGVPGELYIIGPGMARGYHNRASLTSERFVACSYGSPGRRMYRTGDVVRWRESGGDSAKIVGSGDGVHHTLEYIGRSDFQVKVRGFRIELGEIDAVLSRHPSVDLAATVGHTGPSGETVLVSYVRASAADATGTDEIRAYAADRLPSHMVPSAVVLLERIPMTPVGKLDRKALPEPEFGSAAAEFREPVTDTERAVVDSFVEVLGVDRVSTTDSFFDLGGSSLVATRIVSALHSRFRRRIPLQWMFLDPTPAGIARRLDMPTADAGMEELLAVVVPLRTKGTGRPLFCVHPGIGLSWGYAGLVRYLPEDRPVYGLQLPALSDDGDYQSIEQLAHRYVEEVEAVSPDGPYDLLGWSLGGVIAHAMAVELQSSGRDVATLAMMDSYPDNGNAPASAELDVRDLLRGLGLEIETDRDLTFDEAAAVLARRLGPETGVDGRDLERIARGYETSQRITHQFVPQVYEGDLLIFLASGEDDTIPRDRSPQEWSPLVTGRIVEVPVRCEHNEMIEPPAMAVIGPVLARVLSMFSGYSERA